MNPTNPFRKFRCLNLRCASIQFVAIMLLTIPVSYAQPMSSNWKHEAETSLQQFLNCANTSTDKYQCSAYIGEAIAKIYKLDNLYSEKDGRYLLITELSKSMSEHGEWKLLGHAYEQKVLVEAQEYANANKAVIAVYKTTTGVGHIAVILPGSLQYSGSWGFNVPNSASFSFNEPAKSYAGKGLSYAFTKNMIKDIELYSSAY
jgi:hypothetical protein